MPIDPTNSHLNKAAIYIPQLDSK